MGADDDDEEIRLACSCGCTARVKRHLLEKETTTMDRGGGTQDLGEAWTRNSSAVMQYGLRGVKLFTGSCPVLGRCTLDFACCFRACMPDF